MGGEQSQQGQVQQHQDAGQHDKVASTGAGVTALRHLLKGGGPPSVETVSTFVQIFPADRDAMLALLHQSLGNQFVHQVMQRVEAGQKPASASLAAEVANDHASLDSNRQIRATLLPAFARAVGALDPAAAAQLAIHIIATFKRSLAAHSAAAGKLEHGRENALTSTAGSSISDTEGEGRLADLRVTDGVLNLDLISLAHELAVKLGPQTFKNNPVMGGGTTTPKLDADIVAHLTSEARTTVELINVAQRALATAGATPTTCAPLSPEQRTQIVSMIEPFRTRPVNLAFLVHAIGPGLATEIMDTVGGSGNSLKKTTDAANAQAKVSGALNDVGDFSSDDVEKLLPGDPDEQAAHRYMHLGDAPASKIYDEIASASPAARGPIVRQVAKLHRLDFLCEHLPKQQIIVLVQDLEPRDPGAAELLRQWLQAHPPGRSMNELYDGNVDDQLEHGHGVRAYATLALQRLHNVVTGGFVDASSAVAEQHEAGQITDDQRSAGMTKALAKSVAVTGAGVATGGLTGEAVAGAAAPLDQLLFKGASTLAGAGAGGFAGGMGAHFAGDAFDHIANGKEGWDSGSDYLTSGLIGAGTGLAMSGVGLIGSKYLPAEQRTLASGYAERYPRMTALLEQARQFGATSRGAVAAAGRAAVQRITMTLAKLQELVDSGGMGSLPETALAGNGSEVSLSSLPRGAKVQVSISTLEDLNKPMQSTGPDSFDGPAFAIDKVEIVEQPGKVGVNEQEMSTQGDTPEGTATRERDGKSASSSEETEPAPDQQSQTKTVTKQAPESESGEGAEDRDAHRAPESTRKPPAPDTERNEGGDQSKGHDDEPHQSSVATDRLGRQPTRFKQDLVWVRESDIVITDRVGAEEWTINIEAPLPNGRMQIVAYGTTLLDSNGMPLGGPEFIFDKRVTLGGNELRIAIGDEATGRQTSLTDFALDRSIERFKSRFGHPPEALAGDLAFDNKRNFQIEFLKRRSSGASDQIAAVEAAKNISFGRARVQRGYTDVSVDLGSEVESIDFGSPPRPTSAPKRVRVTARKP